MSQARARSETAGGVVLATLLLLLWCAPLPACGPVGGLGEATVAAAAAAVDLLAPAPAVVVAAAEVAVTVVPRPPHPARPQPWRRSVVDHGLPEPRAPDAA